MSQSKQKETRPYGLWPSPITPQSMAGGTRLGDLAWDGDGRTLVWLEGRGDQGVLVAQTDTDAPRDLTVGQSVRARVGYGGGDFGVAGGFVYFADAASGRLFRQPLAAGAARPITPAFGHAAAPAISPDGRWVLYVHANEGVDRLALVDVEGRNWPRIVAEGADFYMQPRWSPDGTQVAWIQWDHPQMPWDGTTLHLAAVRPPSADGDLPTLADARPIAGDRETAIFGPEFSPDGRSLAYISDESGWDNLYLHDLTTGQRRALTTDTVDLGQPAWAQGMRAYAFGPGGGGILFLRNEGGFRRVWAYDFKSETAQPLPLLPNYTWIEQPAWSVASGRIAAIGSSSAIPARIVATDGHGGNPRICARSAAERVPGSELSSPRPVSWAADGGATVHGLYYPPTSSHYKGAGLPPAIVRVHGGPTGAANAGYNAAAQFFTSRGYVVLEVNHRGSTSHGRDYVRALREGWGVVDVEDTAAGARFLAAEGLADGERLVVMGGSAGGYTVLQTLVTHPGLFKAALCLYGIANLFTLAADTHKFEARYLDALVGPLPAARDRYRERSPIYGADRISDPIAIFQGANDPVVPPAQSELIVAALRRRGIPHEYHVYEGEGHGWRKRETIAAFWTAVERFLREYVIFG
ncbi:MAG: Prolyl oligopeptidase family protein [uncultured Thermomicrobiales bacterium]|uniref:Prolyl oligopeptidase family protein n=1 Tax=uncultured Thermomicrobiales bacterium TaxID=1645740 RepID=A0A6J4VRD6_9BACT|nr:MAG: Prolyl oligopeptidase family protein [uncultured Thermomicrobiales bacterium]